MEDTLERWRSEKTAAYLSGAVAGVEPDPVKEKLFATWRRRPNSRLAFSPRI